jgi:hypothetical protein
MSYASCVSARNTKAAVDVCKPRLWRRSFLGLKFKTRMNGAAVIKGPGTDFTLKRLPKSV